MHQDAHEFLNFLLNNIGEVLQAEHKSEWERKTAKRTAELSLEDKERDRDTTETESERKRERAENRAKESESESESVRDGERDIENSWKKYPRTLGGTFVHDVFEGVLTNETRCLCCETITSRDEGFLDLSVDVEENSSLTHCLNSFSSVETLDGSNKFFCENCCSLQEAHRRYVSLARRQRLPMPRTGQKSL